MSPNPATTPATTPVADAVASKAGPYSTRKMLHHLSAIDAMRARSPQNPIQIHFMPALACQQKCQFCSYGHRAKDDNPSAFGWKNMQMMSNEYMPLDKMRECVKCWIDLDVKAVEITGGGEPLVYPFIGELFDELADTFIDTALVTNGVGLTEEMCRRFDNTGWRWARVSIDAGCAETYTKLRRVPEWHWKRAWYAVEYLATARDAAKDPDIRVGVGFVVDANNYWDIFACCQLAKNAGADNVRVSLAHTPVGAARFPTNSLEVARKQIEAAVSELGDATFTVNNLVGERAANLESPIQDYPYCPVKDVLCVVGGDCNVYTCCVLAFNKNGLIGSIKDCSFTDLWQSAAKQKFFANHRPYRICKCACLYEKRNHDIMKMLEEPRSTLERWSANEAPIHENFI